MTQAVLFDVLPKPGHVDQYFEMATQLKPIVQQNPGFCRSLVGKTKSP